MRRISSVIIVLLAYLQTVQAQDRTVQNRPYTDLRPFHFGVLVGTHFQDIELVNAGPQVITMDDGSQVHSIVTADQDRWDAGLNVGVLGEFRLSTYFQFRLAPAMYFGTRHITFHNFTPSETSPKQIEETQGMRTAYISTAMDLIFAAPRFNNYRPYLMAGLNPMINLSGSDNDYLKLNRYDAYLELGVGCDLYLPFFKLRPELKFMYGLTNALDTNHANDIRDKNMLRFTNSVKEAHTKMIALTFYFE